MPNMKIFNCDRPVSIKRFSDVSFVPTNATNYSIVYDDEAKKWKNSRYVSRWIPPSLLFVRETTTAPQFYGLYSTLSKQLVTGMVGNMFKWPATGLVFGSLMKFPKGHENGMQFKVELYTGHTDATVITGVSAYVYYIKIGNDLITTNIVTNDKLATTQPRSSDTVTRDLVSKNVDKITTTSYQFTPPTGYGTDNDLVYVYFNGNTSYSSLVFVSGIMWTFFNE